MIIIKISKISFAAITYYISIPFNDFMMIVCFTFAASIHAIAVSFYQRIMELKQQQYY